MKFEPGDLVQLMKGVVGQGEVGVVLGPVGGIGWDKNNVEVLLHEGPVSCHPTNLRAPDGRLKPRR